MFASSLCKSGGERLILLYFFYTEICISTENMSTPDSKHILISSINEHHLPSSTFSQNQLTAKILQYCFLKTAFMFTVVFFFFFNYFEVQSFMTSCSQVFLLKNPVLHILWTNNWYKIKLVVPAEHLTGMCCFLHPRGGWLLPFCVWWWSICSSCLLPWASFYITISFWQRFWDGGEQAE